jgi:hypothetical protein
VARRRTAANRDALDRLTACLLEHETVSGDLAELLADAQASAARYPATKALR